MNNERNRLLAYQQRIAQNYRNANGGRYVRNANGAVAQPLDSIDKRITVKINPIDSTVAGKCRVFGYNISPDETYNTTNNMTVVVPERSHAYIKSYSNANPFRIKGILYTVSAAAQLSNPFVFNYRTIGGSLTQKTWQPEAYDDPMYQKTNQIKTSDLQYVVDGDTDIEIDFDATYYASIVFTIIDKLNSAQLLSGKTPIMSSM